MKSLLYVFVYGRMKISTCIYRQIVSICSDILVQRKRCLFCAYIPKSYINGTRQKDREKCEVSVDGPELMPDFLTVMGIPPKHDRSNSIMQVSFSYRPAPGSETSGNPFYPVITGQFSFKDIPVHGSGTFSLCIEQAFASLYPPSLEL